MDEELPNLVGEVTRIRSTLDEKGLPLTVVYITISRRSIPHPPPQYVSGWKALQEPIETFNESEVERFAAYEKELDARNAFNYRLDFLVLSLVRLTQEAKDPVNTWHLFGDLVELERILDPEGVAHTQLVVEFRYRSPPVEPSDYLLDWRRIYYRKKPKDKSLLERFEVYDALRLEYNNKDRALTRLHLGRILVCQGED
jgi:hypothetical protein